MTLQKSKSKSSDLKSSKTIECTNCQATDDEIPLFKSSRQGEEIWFCLNCLTDLVRYSNN